MKSIVELHKVQIDITFYSQILTGLTNSFFTNTISKLSTNNSAKKDSDTTPHYDILKENFELLNTELLKNEDSNHIIGKINKNSEYIFASRVNSSKYEIINLQKLFYESLEKFSLNISYIANLQKELVLKFSNKAEYVNFNFKYCSEKFLSQKHFLRVY